MTLIENCTQINKLSFKLTFMQLKLFLKFSIDLPCFLVTCFSFGVKPFSGPIEGQVNSTFGGAIGNCKASSKEEYNTV